ncbi:anti-sigma factor [Aureimonas altamirensis]|uniref:anti-sigma factor n=1 Tax=Aureimonas altamirensis TaxID=370622 RepID=UPI00203682E0|nr:anti-sigma factor [Aureimonas altamirensis]MCM2505353.1 anti-sigma factor [Aureimonas altamirensis]
MSAVDDFDDEDFLAAEFTLGTLDEAARSRAAHRYASDPAFAAEVDRWSRILAPLAADAVSVEPPAELWQRISDRTRKPVPVAVAATHLVSATWRWLAIGSMAVAAASLAVLLVLVQPAERPAGPAFSSVVAAQSGQPLAVVTLSPDGRSVTVTPLSLPRTAGRVAELWYVPAGRTPRSMGVVEAGSTYAMTLDTPLPADAQGDAFALSDEPAGGSPTGLPTGPIIGQGALGAV